MPQKQPYQNRTAIVHFGATKQDYLDLVQSEDCKALIVHLQGPLQGQLSAERHKPGCVDTSHYTIHGFRERQMQSWLGQAETIPICRTRCQSCPGSLHRVGQLHLAVSPPRCRLPGKVAGVKSRDGTQPERDGDHL
jgi:hypothetical protein